MHACDVETNKLTELLLNTYFCIEWTQLRHHPSAVKIRQHFR